MRKIKSLCALFVPVLFLASATVWSASTTAAGQSETTGQYVSDASITAKVKSDLLLNNDIKSLQISVKTTRGVVTLSGNVGSDMQKQEAENVAKQVTGVKAVKDKLKISPNGTSQTSQASQTSQPSQ